MKLRTFAIDDTDQVIDLWQRCGLTRPWNDPRKDIERKLSTQPELFLVLEHDGKLVGTAMGGYDGHRGWVNYLAIAPETRNRGAGRMLMTRLEQMLVERGCPKLNLQVRSDNAAAIGFYSQLGYAQDEVISLGKRLIDDA